MEPTYRYKLGRQIAGYRSLKGWSQEYLALETGLCRSYIGRVERGEVSVGIDNLEKIAQGLGIPIYRLFFMGVELVPQNPGNNAPSTT